MWKERIELPATAVDLEDLLGILLGSLDRETVLEFAGELEAFHRPCVFMDEE